MTAVDIDRLAALADSLRAAARQFGTPLYATDVATIDAAADAVRAAFPDPWLRHYSVKANDLTAIVARLAELGFGANVVSRGEWGIARRAGLANERVTLEGIGKTDADLRSAVRAARSGAPLRWIAVESADELAVLERLARGSPLRGAAATRGSGRRRSGADRPGSEGVAPGGIVAAARGSTGAAAPVEVLFRLNPDVVPETHPGLAVGAGGSKFGLTETELSAAVESVAAGSALRARGIQVHVGSQLGAVDAWRDGVRRALALLALLRGSLPDFDTLDVGGGFPVARLGDPAPTPERFARELPELLDAVPEDRRPRRLAVEPGRFLVARAGWLVARVLHVRTAGGRRLVIDAGMTELIRPALYGASHDIVALTSLGRRVDGTDFAADALEPARVDGPICESTDELGDHRLPPLRRGDLVAIRDAGAYASSQSSTYNGRTRPAQVLIQADGSPVLARRRGSLASLG